VIVYRRLPPSSSITTLRVLRVAGWAVVVWEPGYLLVRQMPWGIDRTAEELERDVSNARRASLVG
jgi:hypothetical protein